MNYPTYLSVDGPLALHRESFWSHLNSLGYRPQPAVCQMHLFADLSLWLKKAKLTACSINHACLDAFLIKRRKNGKLRLTTSVSLFAITDFLEKEGIATAAALVAIPSGPHRTLLDGYKTWLEGECSMEPRRACIYDQVATQFLLESVGDIEPVDLEALTPVHVLDFVYARRQKYCASTVGLVLSQLRKFLHFLFLHELTTHDLRGAVPAVAHARQKSLPLTLDAEETQRVLDSCDRSRHVGRRDFAILLLMLQLGLRRGDVSALTLDDIDWKAGDFRVSGKSRREERLPLPELIGAAIADYIRHSRPTTNERQIFFTTRAPRRPLHSYSITNLIKAACVRAELPAGHLPRLRHTAASLMLGAGASLDEIAQVLRHRSVETTAIYAKIDDQALGELIREWPRVSS